MVLTEEVILVQLRDLASLPRGVGIVDRDAACPGGDYVERAPRLPLFCLGVKQTSCGRYPGMTTCTGKSAQFILVTCRRVLLLLCPSEARGSDEGENMCFVPSTSAKPLDHAEGL